jgi:hypothetical protein
VDREPTAPDQVVRPLRPLVWGLAVVWLALQRTGDGLFRVLDGYDRAANALARAAARAGRALLRVLGPLGRLLRRLAAPVLRLLRRVWDVLGVQLLLRMFRPLGRWARAVWGRLHPLVDRLQQALRRLAARLQPLLHALVAVTSAVQAAAGRLGARCRRAWAPVTRAVQALRRPRRGVSPAGP